MTLSLCSRLRFLLKKKPKNLLLFAESRVLSEMLAAKLGCTIFEFPCPTTIEIPKLAVAKKQKSNNPFFRFIIFILNKFKTK
jgi:hypothetical protein